LVARDRRGNQIVTVSQVGSAAFLIGRSHSCDLRLTSDQVSRIHVVLFVIPKNRVIAVDLGSRCGITVTSRSDATKPLQSSTMGKRAVLTFSWHEAFALLLGDATVNFAWSKMCLICLERPRALRFAECGHLVICAACAAGLRDCPLCRVAVIPAQADRLSSTVGASACMTFVGH
jgi:hypothetical protein